jgi:hypothetical protein
MVSDLKHRGRQFRMSCENPPVPPTRIANESKPEQKRFFVQIRKVWSLERKVITGAFVTKESRGAVNIRVCTSCATGTTSSFPSLARKQCLVRLVRDACEKRCLIGGMTLLEAFTGLLEGNY